MSERGARGKAVLGPKFHELWNLCPSRMLYYNGQISGMRVIEVIAINMVSGRP